MTDGGPRFPRWEDADPILTRALELPEAERPAFLQQACGGDAALERYLSELLRLAETEDRYLTEGGALSGRLGLELATEGQRPESAAPRQIGPWRLRHELGHGGMGAVWLAERADGQFEKQVALKLIGSGGPSKAAVRRFERERRILATLNHPHIAALIDGGLTPEGDPWFAMEYVDGEPIDVFCDGRRLSVEGRLRLFVKVARAVHAAHQRGVVHGDLKPSNVLVTREGYPRLLDFGIARQLLSSPDSDAGGGTVQAMTPAYASPEQVVGDAVTPASDVYQLGLLLYELLTGRRAQRFDTTRPVELERTVCHESPVLPSRAVFEVGAAAAEARRTTLQSLSRRLRGDLDAIAMTALRKDPRRRYAAVSDLVEDIERHLAAQPVRARPETWTYRTGRFLTRHRVGALAAGVTLAALTAALVFGMMASGRLETPRQLRSRERAEALRLLQLGQERLRNVACGTEEILLLEQAIERDPSLVAARGDLGWALYNQVTHCGKESSYFDRALLAARSARAADPEYADAWQLEAAILVETGRAEEAFERIRDATRQLPPSPELHFTVAYVATYAGYLDLAAAELDRALALEPTYLARAGWSPNAYLYRGELAKFVRVLPSVDSPFFRFYRAWVHVLEGAPAAARAELEPAFPMNPPDVFARLDRALLAVLSGDVSLGRDVVRELARQRRELGASDGEFTLKQAQVLAFAGEPAEAAAQLRLAVEQGFFCPACIESDPVLAGLTAEPDYLVAIEAARRRHESFGRQFGLTPSSRRSAA